MKSGPQIALAVGIGYALGRSRKMKLAIMVGTMMAGRRLPLDPRELLAQGGKLVGGSPELKKLTGEARDRLMDAAKTAAMAAATNKIDSIGDNLSKRAAGLRAPRVKDKVPAEIPGGAADEESEEEAVGTGSSRNDGRDRRSADDEPERSRSGDRQRSPEAEDVPQPRASTSRRADATSNRSAGRSGGRTGNRTKSGATSRNESRSSARSSGGD